MIAMSDYARAKKYLSVAAMFLTLAAASAFCQQGSADDCSNASLQAKLPEFEVATIKPFGSSGIAGILTYPGGRVAAGHLNLRMLLMFACNLQMYQVIGGPAWVDSDFFNIEAKPPDASFSAKSNPANPKLPMNEEQRQMLLALLIDRFHLKFHVESKEGPVYLLERGKGELKLNPPKDPSEIPWVGGVEGGAIYLPTGIAGKNVSIPLFAAQLSRYLERPIIDKTGITGSYDFRFKTNDLDPAVPVTRDDVISSILTSVRGIGLKLTPAKDPIETIVIDRAEPPSPN
jgi:uncharacterized protein (TIGR03435 family)